MQNECKCLRKWNRVIVSEMLKKKKVMLVEEWNSSSAEIYPRGVEVRIKWDDNVARCFRMPIDRIEFLMKMLHILKIRLLSFHSLSGSVVHRFWEVLKLFTPPAQKRANFSKDMFTSNIVSAMKINNTLCHCINTNIPFNYALFRIYDVYIIGHNVEVLWYFLLITYVCHRLADYRQSSSNLYITA